MRLRTSSPLINLPKVVYLLSSCIRLGVRHWGEQGMLCACRDACARQSQDLGALTDGRLPRQTKNWEPAESGSLALAIDRTPNSCLRGLNSAFTL